MYPAGLEWPELRCLFGIDLPWWRGKYQPPAMEEQCKPAEKSIAKELKLCNSVLSWTQTVGHYLLCCGVGFAKRLFLLFPGVAGSS